MHTTSFLLSVAAMCHAVAPCVDRNASCSTSTLVACQSASFTERCCVSCRSLASGVEADAKPSEQDGLADDADEISVEAMPIRIVWVHESTAGVGNVYITDTRVVFEVMDTAGCQLDFYTAEGARHEIKYMPDTSVNPAPSMLGNQVFLYRGALPKHNDLETGVLFDLNGTSWFGDYLVELQCPGREPASTAFFILRPPALIQAVAQGQRIKVQLIGTEHSEWEWDFHSTKQRLLHRVSDFTSDCWIRVTLNGTRLTVSHRFRKPFVCGCARSAGARA